MTASRVPIERILELFYDEELEGFHDVRTIADGHVDQTFVPLHDAAALRAFVAPRRARQNCYVGAAVRRTDANGTLANCSLLPLLFADLDFHGSTEGDTRARLTAFPFPPTMTVATGGGLHGWWLLKDPLDLATEAPRAKTLLRRLAQHLAADRLAAEPARVLRLPHTYNFKFTPPRLVAVETFDPFARFTVLELDDFLPSVAADPSSPGSLGDDRIPTGQRNATLTRIAGAMRRHGASEAAMIAALAIVNAERCAPPLPEADVRRIARSVGRYAPTEGEAGPPPPASIVVTLPTLLADHAAQAGPRPLVEDLLPGDGSVLIHGQPRDSKTITSFALLLAVASGQPAFGLERLHVPEAVPCWYITQEDSEWRVADRFRQLVAGAGFAAPPALLHVSAGHGITLDREDWQDTLIATTRQYGFRLVVLDPLRSLTATVDQGPRELKPFVLFLRRFLQETHAVLCLVHHDTKPPVQTADQRHRPQRASGGGVFAIADSPIHLERIDENRRLLVPCAFKFAADPPSVLLRLDTTNGLLRVLGEDATASRHDHQALDLRLLEHLRQSPYQTGTEMVRAIHMQKATVFARLEALRAQGLVDAVQNGQAKRWFLVGA